MRFSREPLWPVVVSLLLGIGTPSSFGAAVDASNRVDQLDRKASASPKSLRRLHDPVVVRTDVLTSLPDHRTSAYRLYAVHGETIEPIPFQFDGRDDQGDLVVSGELVDEFRFGQADELVFMAKDTGDHAEGVRWPDGSDVGTEIEVTDSRTGERGWAYLLHFQTAPPPRSPVRYARFDEGRQEADALAYVVRYAHDKSNFFAGLRVKPEGGGTGEEAIGRTRMLIQPTFSFFVTSWSPRFTETSFSVEENGLKNGTVRAIRRVRQSLDLGRFFPEIPNGTVYTFYYFDSFFTPSTFRVPALALDVLRDFRFEAVEQIGARSDETRYFDGANPQGVRSTGDRAPEGMRDDHDWWVLSGPAGTILHSLSLPEEWRSWGITRGSVLESDASNSEVPGPGAGETLLHMTNLRAPGSYRLGSAFVVLPRPYRPGDEADALAMLQEPLRISVHVIGVSQSSRPSDTRP